jgi:MoaA/NifB/PqqE/SkfB family radical SAM enzyme
MTNGKIRVPSIDIYLTYRCNMRCQHCFVGEHLDSARNMPWPSLAKLLEVAHDSWATNEISFLGGEPTLYPSIVAAVRLAQNLGYHTRIITNGGTSARRLIRTELPQPLHFAFSLDGSTAEKHDAIRRRGSFRRTLENLTEARAKGHSLSIIVSVGQHNLYDAIQTIRLADKCGVDYINVHFVTDRGFATDDMVIDIGSWDHFHQVLQSACIPTKIRFERTFIPAASPSRCLAADDSMLMFFPDGKVYTCSMYFNQIEGHAYLWNNTGLIKNSGFRARYGSHLAEGRHCPAMYTVNKRLVDQAESNGRCIGCIFDKQLIGERGGLCLPCLNSP